MAKRCEHNWERLFKFPTRANVQKLHIDALFELRYIRDTARICTLCGKHGYQSRGYSRGGAQVIRPYRGYSEELLLEAAAWNLRIETELVSITDCPDCTPDKR